MDVLIDTNVIRQNWKLNGKNFDALADYLAKTNSKLVVPSLVMEETQGLYRRFLAEKLQEMQKCKSKMEATVLFRNLPDIPDFDLDTDSKKYLDYVYEKLNMDPRDIIQYKNDYLPEIVDRAINRKKPLDANGQQFRDGLLWLTLLDHAATTEDKVVVFISNNPVDFSDSKKEKLAPELCEEAKQRGVEIKLFFSLTDFVRSHAEKIEFITEEWINANLDDEKIGELFLERTDSSFGHELLEGIELDHDERTTGSHSRTDYINLNLLDFYVYEKRDKTLLLDMDFEIESEVEVEVEKIREDDRPRFEFEYNLNPSTGNLDRDMVYVPETSVRKERSYKHVYPIFRCRFFAIVSDGKIQDYSFEDWSLS
jgi:PIN domain